MFDISEARNYAHTFWFQTSRTSAMPRGIATSGRRKYVFGRMLVITSAHLDIIASPLACTQQTQPEVREVLAVKWLWLSDKMQSDMMSYVVMSWCSRQQCLGISYPVLHLHLVGAGVQQDGVLVDELGSLFGLQHSNIGGLAHDIPVDTNILHISLHITRRPAHHAEVVAKQIHPTQLVLLGGPPAVVASEAHVQHRLCRCLATLANNSTDPRQRMGQTP